MSKLEYVSNDVTVRIEPRDGSTDEIVAKEAFVENTYNLHPDDFAHSGVFVDLGANVGAVTLLAKTLGAKRLIAFEPEPSNFRMLEANLKENGVEAELHNVAVWDTECELPLVPLYGNSTSDEKTVKQHSDSVLSVPAVDIAKALETITDIDVLKVDIEGAEYRVLMRPTVNVKARKIVVEFHNSCIRDFGNLIAMLVLTHNVRVFGKWTEHGGQIEALRY